MHDVKENKQERAKSNAKFHDGIRLGLRMKSGESITGTPNGVMYQHWR